ncbi:uncharacterized protein LOC117315853 [Pecten maximus]|uniref:uncharacterized protein LOC117315853 n=1 Tax=Pecten maximus TaxID=6579 RepID=UPI0014585664|nr:uncharacterized protein LOC117315853 [Pecten maximus]
MVKIEKRQMLKIERGGDKDREEDDNQNREENNHEDREKDAQPNFSPTNLTAVYVANGNITVTWNRPNTSQMIDNYLIEFMDARTPSDSDEALLDNVYKYQYTHPKASSTYVIKVSIVMSDGSTVSSLTTVNTAQAIYRNRRTRTKLTLPRPPGTGTSTIKFNGDSSFAFIDGKSYDSNGNSASVSLTSTNAELTIERLGMRDAGYYCLVADSGNVLGGQFLVVTDTPTQPTIISPTTFPPLDSSVTLECSSRSRSKPFNHGLVLTSNWKLNGSNIYDDRFSIHGTSIVIHQVQTRDTYNRYTCVTYEIGQDYAGLASEESEEFQLTPISSQSKSRFSPTNLMAVYVANGTIRVTWNPPRSAWSTRSYLVKVKEEESQNISSKYLSERLFQYHNPKPNSLYAINVSSIGKFYAVIGSSMTFLNTETAKYRSIGDRTRLTLPKPPDRSTSAIQFNGRTLFTFTNGDVSGDAVNNDGVTVSLASASAYLTMASVRKTDAGYYYTVNERGNVLGGQLLVATDAPTQPIITSSRITYVGRSVTLRCSSTSRSQPYNHGLVLVFTWEINNTVVYGERFNVTGRRLSIDPVQRNDKFDKYTCVTYEKGLGHIAANSSRSRDFKLRVRYVSTSDSADDTDDTDDTDDSNSFKDSIGYFDGFYYLWFLLLLLALVLLGMVVLRARKRLFYYERTTLTMTYKYL